MGDGGAIHLDEGVVSVGRRDEHVLERRGSVIRNRLSTAQDDATTLGVQVNVVTNAAYPRLGNDLVRLEPLLVVGP